MQVDIAKITLAAVMSPNDTNGCMKKKGIGTNNSVIDRNENETGCFVICFLNLNN